ncbi:MAG: hypothetical protein OXN89_04340 [Bryobacterales bacterium]|nr:hypothetical protein [Bryobacterales bacterium]
MTPSDPRADPIVYAVTIDRGGERQWFGNIQPCAGGLWGAWDADDAPVEGGVEQMLEDLSAPFEKVGGREIKVLAGPRSAMVQDRKEYALRWEAWTAPERWWRWGTEDHDPAQRYSNEDGCIINTTREDVVQNFRQYLKDRGCRL